jgi:hypothetical protein
LQDTVPSGTKLCGTTLRLYGKVLHFKRLWAQHAVAAGRAAAQKEAGARRGRRKVGLPSSQDVPSPPLKVESAAVSRQAVAPAQDGRLLPQGGATAVARRAVRRGCRKEGPSAQDEMPPPRGGTRCRRHHETGRRRRKEGRRRRRMIGRYNQVCWQKS